MLDVVYLAAILALFALIALVAHGVEKLGPPPGTPAGRASGRSAPPSRGAAALRGGEDA